MGKCAKLVSIINKNTKQNVCMYYTGELIDLNKSIIEKNKDLIIYYKDGFHFKHETVLNISYDNNKFIVETTKKIWFFTYN